MEARLVSQPKANEQLMRRWFEEVWNQKSEAAIDELLAQDCVAYGLPDPDAVVRGPEQFKEFHRVFCGAFPDLHITVEDVIASGDRVAARWRAIGTHLGAHLGFPATGKKVTLDGATIAVIHDGRLKQGWNMMDMGHFFESLRGEGARF
jgi:steroid delta-isomerase-like uncharacterized protein